MAPKAPAQAAQLALTNCRRLKPQQAHRTGSWNVFIV